MTKKRGIGSSFDDFLKEEGIYEEVMVERIKEIQKTYGILVNRKQKIIETLAQLENYVNGNGVYEAMKDMQASELYIIRLAKDRLEDLVNAEFGSHMVELMVTNKDMVEEYNRQTESFNKFLGE